MTEAREYRGPVRPRRSAHWDSVCGNGAEAGRSEEWRAGFNHAMQTVALWLDFQVSRDPRAESTGFPGNPGLSSIGMLKSNLLGRLMRDDEIRRVPCPTHRGQLQFFSSAIGTDVACCDGTGWLPNEAGQSEVDPDERRGTHWLTHAWKESWWHDPMADGPG